MSNKKIPWILLFFTWTLFANVPAQIQIPKETEYFNIIRVEGPERGEYIFDQVRMIFPDTVFFTENAMNNLGYEFLYNNKFEEALKVFNLNIRAYPHSWNVYDSMAEAFMFNGENDKAIEYYKKSAEINPDNLNGIRFIKVLSNYRKMEMQIPMRDGKRLFTSIYLPLDTTKNYPMMINRTPYSVRPYGAKGHKNQLGPSEIMMDDRYIFVYQDVRGRYMSEGEYVNVRPHIPVKNGPSAIDESSDTYDSIEWLLKNVPNHNGRVGMWGISYPGFYAIMGAVNAHPALLAVSPQAPIADWFIGDDFHHNGALFLAQGFSFFRNFGLPRPEPTTNRKSGFEFPTPDGYDFYLNMGPLKNANNYLENRVSFWNEVMMHGVYDAFWQERSILPHLTNVRPAILTVGGWFDAEDLYGPLNIYKTIEKNNPESQNQLVMGPWYHGGWARSKGDMLGDIHFSSNTGYFYQKNIEFRFFNHYLKGDGSLDLPEAFVFETGSNQWRQYDQWPPQNVQEKRLYLHTNGSLSYMKPREKEDSFSEYISDPDKPVPYINEIRNSTPIEFMVADQRFIATRPDVLVYKSAILTEDLTIAGPLTSVLFVSTSGTDADWIVKLIDVFPDDAPDIYPNPKDVRMGGYQMMVRGEVMRSKFRYSYEIPESMVPNKITKIEFTLPDINHTFLTGHKIMVQIQSSWFPLVDRNPQKFVDIYHADESDFQKAVQRVYHSDKFPSHLKINFLVKSD